MVIGKDIEASFSGIPEGLSFFKIIVAGPMYDRDILTSALNSTNFSVIQSPSAFAGPFQSTFPFLSKTRTGKEASKYQVPRAFPMTLNCLPVTAPGYGRSTTIRSSVAFL